MTRDTDGLAGGLSHARKACQGYCGGYARLKDMRQVGPEGEQFCPECYEQNLSEQ